MITKKYKIRFNQYQYTIFQQLDANGGKRGYLMSVMSYLIKYSNEEGLVIKSLSKLFSMYQRYHKKKNSDTKSISRSYFFKLIDELVDLKLLTKDGRKVFIFNEKVDEKIDEKVDIKNSYESVENIKLEEDLSSPKDKGLNRDNYYTNTDIVGMLKSFYKGIKDKQFASKKDLIDVAKSLFVLDRINEPIVQANVISKLRNSKQQIHLNGIVQYVNSVIMDKLSEFDSYTYTQLSYA